MTQILTRTRAIGGSLVATIPVEIVKTEKLQENELIEIEIKKTRRNFFGALKGIGNFTRDDRMKDRN